MGLCRIDIHSHPPLDLRKASSDPSGQFLLEALAAWKVDEELSRMDRLGIDVQVISLPILPVSVEGGVAAKWVARKSNEYMANIVAKRPDRFSALATVPADNGEMAFEELVVALDDFNLDGLALSSSCNGHYLGDDLFEPVMTEVERRGVPIFVHPAASGDFVRCSPGEPPYVVEFPFDTARAVIHAIYSGLFRRHPYLKMILAHCGGALPALAWRVEILIAMSQSRANFGVTSDEVRYALSNLYYETALASDKAVLQAVLEVTKIDHLLFGTDSGAVSVDIVNANIDRLLQAGLSDAELGLIESGNAQKLIPRFAAKEALINEPAAGDPAHSARDF